MILRFLTDGDSEGTSKPWAANIGAAVLVQLATFSGLLAIALSKAHRSLCPQQNEKLNKNSKLWKCAVELGIPSFAAGALLATAFFLIIPEALELLGGHHGHEEEGNDEQEVAWKFGTALMAGFIFPVLLSSMFPSSVHHTDKESPHSEVYGNVSEVDKVSEDLWEVTESIALDVNDGKNDEEVPDKTARPFKKGESKSDDEQTEMIKSCSDKCDTLAPEDTLTPGRPPQVVQCKNYSLAASILLGDMFHNATDGFFIGTAFLLCSRYWHGQSSHQRCTTN